MSSLQLFVVNEAKNRLIKDGIDVICLDMLPSDEVIKESGFEDIVRQLYDDTLYWERGVAV